MKVGFKYEYVLFGVFLFVGLLGVGKIEMVLVLVDLLFGGEVVFMMINMLEY